MLDVLVSETEIIRTMVNLRLEADVIMALGQQAEVRGQVEEGFHKLGKQYW